MRLVGFVAVFAVLMGGCSSSGTGGSGSASASAEGGSSTAVYLQVIRDYVPGKTDKELLALGHGICRELDDGMTWTQVVEGFVSGGMDAEKAGGAIATAVATLCPAHKADLPSS